MRYYYGEKSYEHTTYDVVIKYNPFSGEKVVMEFFSAHSAIGTPTDGV